MLSYKVLIDDKESTLVFNPKQSNYIWRSFFQHDNKGRNIAEHTFPVGVRLFSGHSFRINGHNYKVL